jgi:hypothetical protein
MPFHPDECVHVRDGAEVYAVVRVMRRERPDRQGEAFDDLTSLCASCTGKVSAVIAGLGVDAC